MPYPSWPKRWGRVNVPCLNHLPVLQNPKTDKTSSYRWMSTNAFVNKYSTAVRLWVLTQLIIVILLYLSFSFLSQLSVPLLFFRYLPSTIIHQYVRSYEYETVASPSHRTCTISRNILIPSRSLRIKERRLTHDCDTLSIWRIFRKHPIEPHEWRPK